MKRQDVVGARTAQDIPRQYNFGNMNREIKQNREHYIETSQKLGSHDKYLKELNNQLRSHDETLKKIINSNKRVEVNYLINSSNQFELKGFSYINEKIYLDPLYLDVYITDDIVINSDSIILYHKPHKIVDNDGNKNFGYCKNLSLYKKENNNNLISTYLDDTIKYTDNDYKEIANAFGDSGFNPTIPTDDSHDMESIESIDIKDKLQEGINSFCIKSDLNIESILTKLESLENSGFLFALLKINGYKGGNT